MALLAFDKIRALPRSFYDPSAAQVAPALLGHWLLRKERGGYSGGPIVETEAYVQGDAACHAAPGLTERNRVMFGPSGHAYVYFIYGCYFCMNVVCCPAGTAEAVLIRAIEPSFGHDLCLRRRPGRDGRNLTNGPGRLCQALRISRDLNGADLCAAGSSLIVAVNPHLEDYLGAHGPVRISRRIGLTKAADLPLRFYLAGNRFVS